MGFGLALWALVVAFVLWRVPFHMDGDGLMFVAMLTCLALAEWPWRGPGFHFGASLLRGLVLITALLWLASATDTYSMIRNGLSQPVTELTPGGRLSPFFSGVWTMKAAVDAGLRWAGYPICLLVLPTIASGVRSLLTVVHLERERATGARGGNAGA